MKEVVGSLTSERFTYEGSLTSERFTYKGRRYYWPGQSPGFPTYNKIYEGNYKVVCGFSSSFFFFFFFFFYFFFFLFFLLNISSVTKQCSTGEAHFLHDIVILSIPVFIIRFQVHG